MKRTLARVILPVLLSVTAFAQTGNAAPAAAAAPTSAPSTGNKVGIINIQQAILLTNEGKRDLEALDKKFETPRTNLQSLQKEVADMQNQLKTQGDKLNDEARAKLAKDIESKQKTLQRDLEDAQNDYQTQSNEIAQRIGTKLMQSLDNYAKQNGFAVVIDVSSQQSPVLWAAQSVDITKPVIDAYNVVSGVPAPSPSAKPASPAPTAGVTRRTPPTATPAIAKPAAPSTPGSTPK